LLVQLVGFLVVEEDVSGASSLEPVFQNVLVLGVLEGLLKKRALDVTKFKFIAKEGIESRFRW
jgi:hypothetical protein